MRMSRKGFSLIELLVVITILAALAAGGTVWVRIANKKKLRTITDTRLQSIASALELAKSPDRLGYYPPTKTEDLRTAGTKPKKVLTSSQPNDTNVGNETLYICFNMLELALEGFDTEGALINTDDDESADALPGLMNNQLLEYADAWGSPFVYIHSRDYKDLNGVDRYVLGDNEGTEVQAEVAVVEASGQPKRKGSFQLFSMGPDRQPGTDDDIHWGDL